MSRYEQTLGRTVKVKSRWATVYVSLANVELGPRVAQMLNPSRP